jgi:F0F1-type ATP synthase gamma subunit
MLNKKSLLQEVALVDSIKTISEAYQEISVMKMQKIRHSVLYTRQYLAELSDLFYDVKEAYKLELSLEKKKHH